jgi:phage gp16-like protein
MTVNSAIYGLRKTLGLDDDTARDRYYRETGKRSLREMTPGEQVRVMQALQRDARQPASGTPAGRLDGPYAKKLQALWIDGWHLGIVRNRQDAALTAFVERQTRISHTRFLRSAHDAQKAIEGLKDWIAREGGVVWGEHAEPIDAVIDAQGRKLGLDKLDIENSQQTAEAQAYWAWRDGQLEAAEKQAVMQRLGEAVRRSADTRD